MLILNRSSTSARLKILPPYSGIRESTTRTCASNSTSRRAKLEPIKPRPPVIRTRLSLKRLAVSNMIHRLFVLLFDHQPPPQLGQVTRHPDQAGIIKELGFAISAVKMVDGRFGQGETGILNLLHQLHTNHPAILGQFNLIKDNAPHYPKIAVHIFELQAKGQLNDILVYPANNDPVQWVVPF